jgi:hypothetical protein
MTNCLLHHPLGECYAPHSRFPATACRGLAVLYPAGSTVSPNEVCTQSRGWSHSGACSDKSNYQKIVVVVDHFDRSRDQPNSAWQDTSYPRADCPIVLPQKCFEPLLSRHGGSPSDGWPRLICLPLSQHPIWCPAAAPPEPHRLSRSDHTMRDIVSAGLPCAKES